MQVRAIAAAALLALSSVNALAGNSIFNEDGLAEFKSETFTATGSFTQTISFSGLSAGLYSILGDVSGSRVSFSSVSLDGNQWTLTPGAGGKLRGGFIEYNGSAPLTLTLTGFVDATNATLKQANFQGSLAVTAVPEPETYALMLAGLGAVAFVARRRKQQA